MRDIHNYLSDLAANNNKEWFAENRARYEHTREKFLYLTEVLINEIRDFDPAIGYQDPRKCMFRIYRDVRFSADKRPYKTNYGSYIARAGRSGGNPGYYFQVDPVDSFLAGGVFMPAPEMLKAIRTAIYNDPDSFIEIIEDEDFKPYFELYDKDKLKTAPQGFPKDWEHIDLIRYRSYSPFKQIGNDELLDEELLQMVIDSFRRIYRFNQFLYEAIGY
jgi:uncharacterized protein (TIGR02453 family)